jgi:YidC/Oxa1 family membrane protein insertase
MDKRNLIAFILLTIAVFVGWAWLQRQLWPPPEPRAAATKKEEKESKKEEVKPPPQVKLTPTAWKDLEDGLRMFSPSVPASLGGWLYLAEATRPTPEGQPETIMLGGPDYYVRAKLTTRGGGVQALTLTKFQAADREGRPVVGPDGQKVLLDLIPEDPIKASFGLFHFPNPVGKVGDDPPNPALTLGEALWKRESKTKEDRDDNDDWQQVRFSSPPIPGYDHLSIQRIYKLGKKDYHISLTIEIKDTRDPGGQGPARQFRYQLAGPHGVPIEGEWYTYTYRNAVIGMVDSSGNLTRTLEDSRRISFREGGDRVPGGDRGTTFLQYAVVANQYFASGIVVDNEQPTATDGGVDYKSILAWARPTLETREVRGVIRDVDLDAELVSVGDVETKFEVWCRLLPRAIQQLKKLNLRKGDEVLLQAYLVKGQLWAGSVNAGSASRPFLADITVRVNSEIVELKPGETRAHRFMLYQGPVKTMLLGQFTGDKAVDPALVERYTDTLHLNTLTDYRSAGIFGSISQAIRFTDLIIACTKLMHWLLNWLLWVVPNEGLSIILLTVIVRGLMFPISRKQALMSQKMQALAPELKKVQEKFKADPQARTKAMMELYRKHGVNPLGGCLPLLLQMPIFLGLYWALQESIRFRLAPFVWVQNLAAPDMLIRWGTGIPWISDPNNMGGFGYLGPFFNILPVLAVTLMLVQQKMMMPPPTDEQQAMQQKMMKWMMIIFGLLFYKVAAGLCIYFIASSLWGLAERKLLPKRQVAVAAAGAPAGPAPAGKGGPSGGGKGKGRGKKPPEDDKKFQKVKDWWADILNKAKKK